MRHLQAERIELFMENQAFSPTYDMVLPLPSVSKLEWRHTGRLRKRDNSLTGEVRGGAKLYDGEKAWGPINQCCGIGTATFCLCGTGFGFGANTKSNKNSELSGK
jgi:hypothetical protein